MDIVLIEDFRNNFIGKKCIDWRKTMRFDLKFWVYIVILMNSMTSILIGIKFRQNYDIIVGIILFITYLFLLKKWSKDHDLY